MMVTSTGTEVMVEEQVEADTEKETRHLGSNTIPILLGETRVTLSNVRDRVSVPTVSTFI